MRIRPEIDTWLRSSLLANVFTRPEDAGLSTEEIYELGRRRGLGVADVADALRKHPRRAGGRHVLDATWSTLYLIDFNHEYERDLRDVAAFAYVRDAFDAARQADLHGHARLPLRVLLTRAEAEGIDRTSAAVAVTAYRLARQLKAGVHSLHFIGNYAHPREMLGTRSRGHRELYPAASTIDDVRDVCARRGDSQPRTTDPLQAFGAVLEGLGLKKHRVWWDHMVSELAQQDAQRTPTAVLILAAALAEGSLAFAVRRAEQLARASGSRAFVDCGNRWHLEDLVNAAGRDSVRIIDTRLVDVCLWLNEQRQRMHAGRFLAEVATVYSSDISPQDAQLATKTVNQLVAAIMEWLTGNACAVP